MRTKHIIVKTLVADRFEPANQDGGTLTISLDQGDVNRMVKTRLFEDLADHDLSLSNAAYDLANFALAIYTIDQVVSRKTDGFQGWSRHLIVYFPVNDKDLWDTLIHDWSDQLSFLSGDKWEFVFRQTQEIREQEVGVERNAGGFTVVSLFSGGMDSFIGAVDLLSEGAKPFFVSHYKSSESVVQDKLFDQLEQQFGQESFGRQKIRVQPNQRNPFASKENSSRARSILFITLGIVVANSLGEELELILPENGLISLNIPLTMSRLNSHSTRTTHPYFVDGLNKIFHALGIRNSIRNPYRFKTKGEMIQESLSPDFLRQQIPLTVSCSHPENSRYERQRPGLNCGYCVPCIIRQAAENTVEGVATEYSVANVRQAPPEQRSQKGSDYRAFKLAFSRLDSGSGVNTLSLQIMRAGPIPYDSAEELEEYKSVYQRGMEEVRRFLLG
jgi:7-cyano-7-deazaguanine synthase in queuosine biosynthesis